MNRIIFKHNYLANVFIFLRSLILPSKSVLKKISPGNILEVGCGYGYFTNKIHKDFPESTVLGTDINPKRIKYAKEIYGNSQTLRFECKNSLDSTNNLQKIFNTVVVVDFLHHIDPAAQQLFFLTAYKLLKKNGLLVIKDIDKNYSFKYLINYFHDLIVTRGDASYYLTAKDVFRLSRCAGFRHKTTENIKSIFYPHVLYVFEK